MLTILYTKWYKDCFNKQTLPLNDINQIVTTVENDNGQSN